MLIVDRGDDSQPWLLYFMFVSFVVAIVAVVIFFQYFSVLSSRKTSIEGKFSLAGAWIAMAPNNTPSHYHIMTHSNYCMASCGKLPHSIKKATSAITKMETTGAHRRAKYCALSNRLRKSLDSLRRSTQETVSTIQAILDF